MELPLAEIKVIPGEFMNCHHNMPCAVCQNKKAVLYMDENVFHPCWPCQRNGWGLHKPNTWLGKVLFNALRGYSVKAVPASLKEKQ